MIAIVKILPRWNWLCGVMLVLCFGCTPIASTSSPNQTQKIISSPTKQTTATPTEEVPTIPPPTPTPTKTQEFIPSPTTQITTAPAAIVSNDLVHDADTRTGLDEVDEIIDVVLAKDLNEFRQKIKFTTSSCTHEMALGGPPKCREGEAEGTPVEVLPFLGPEGHFLRRDELNEWQGIDVDGLYTVYRVSDEAFSDRDYPAGEYGIVFRKVEPPFFFTLQVENGNILRIDSLFGPTAEINFERDAQEIFLPPPDVKECPGAPPQRVMVSEEAKVCTISDDLIVREEPGQDGLELTDINPGTIFMIIDGPSCANNWSWWEIELNSGLEGWVAEGGDNIDPYFICPVD